PPAFVLSQDQTLHKNGELIKLLRFKTLLTRFLVSKVTILLFFSLGFCSVFKELVSVVC
ncbi:hypothetical protein ABMB67_004692, partial [Halalkalibacter oceani]